MTYDESITLSARVGQLINSGYTVRYTPAEMTHARAEFSRRELAELRELGLYTGDFELFYVIRTFCERSGLGDAAQGDYLAALFGAARHLDADEFEHDPYLTAVRFPEERRGKILLTYAGYERGELLMYDEPDFSSRLVVPRLGFFSRPVRFPTVYEGEMPWMSVCPSEINSMREQMNAAHGRTLVLGLGLGYYPFIVSQRTAVDRITIVERNPDVIRLFCEFLLPQFPRRDKIEVVEADAIDYLRNTGESAFDFCFADIWEGVVDGAPLYLQIRDQAKRLPQTEFTYWLEPQLRAYLGEALR